MTSLSVAAASFIILLGIMSPSPAHPSPGEAKSDEAVLEDVDAAGAVAIANQWKWSKKEGARLHLFMASESDSGKNGQLQG